MRVDARTKVVALVWADLTDPMNEIMRALNEFHMIKLLEG